jgi:hypothetical protein
MAVCVECLVGREVLERLSSSAILCPVIFHQYAYLFPVLREEDNVTVGLVCVRHFTKHSLRLKTHYCGASIVSTKSALSHSFVR